jgi:ParB family transcriptional regulator, chromosome partitioning protein
MEKDKTSRESAPAAKPRKKMALGKGLGALIPGPSAAPAVQPDDRERAYLLCDIDLIHPNRYQPRRNFAEEELEELSRSIREQGVIQPLLVRKDSHGHDPGYELIAGERRLRAAKLAGLTRVPVVVKELSDTRMLEMSIVENVQREDLNPLEESGAYHRLMSEFGLTQEQVAERVGKSRSAIANFLRLRQLPEEIKATLMDGTLSMGHAKVLLGAQNTAQQMEVWRQIVTRELSVRETEILLNRLKNPPPPPENPEPGSEEIYFSGVADNLSHRFGTKVRINRRGKKGRVEIEFYSNDDLDRLLHLLNPESAP